MRIAIAAAFALAIFSPSVSNAYILDFAKVAPPPPGNLNVPGPGGFITIDGFRLSANTQFAALLVGATIENPQGSAELFPADDIGTGFFRIRTDTPYLLTSFEIESIESSVLFEFGGRSFTSVGVYHFSQSPRTSFLFETTPLQGWFSGSVTLSNVTFALPGAIPEPTTWAMLILGFGAVGTAMRWRARSQMVRQRN